MSGRSSLRHKALIGWGPLLLILVQVAVAGERPDVRAAIAASGLSSGLAVTVGCDEALDADILEAAPDWVLLSVGGDVAAADVRRAKLSAHAGRAVVQPLLSAQVPVCTRAAALLAVDCDALGSMAPDDAEVARALRPFGAAWVKRGGRWALHKGEWPKGLADYPHWLGDAGMSAQVADMEAGPVRSLRWTNQGSKQYNQASMLWVAGGILVSNHPERSEWKRRCLSGYDAFSGLRLWRRDDLGPTASLLREDTDYHYAVAMDRERLVVPGLEATAIVAAVKPDAPPWALAQAIARHRTVSRKAGNPEPLLALDPKTGKTLMSYAQGPDLLKEGRATALLHEGKLIATAGNGLWVLDAATGRQLWHARHAGKQLLFPSANDGRLVVAVGGDVGFTRAHGAMLDLEFTLHEVVAYDLGSGQERWRWRYEHDSALSESHRCALVAQNAGRVWVSVVPLKAKVRDTWVLACLDAASGRPLWVSRHPELGPTDQFVRLAVLGQHLFVSHGADNLLVLSSADGKLVARGRTFQGACLTARASAGYLFHSAVTVSGGPPFLVHRAHPVSGRCHLGAFPAHGMVFAAGGSRCDCDPFLYGISAFGSEGPPAAVERATAAGPGVPGRTVEGDAWRTALRDARRSAWSDRPIAGEPKQMWKVRLDGTRPASNILAEQWEQHPTAEWLSAPVLADGVVAVSLPHVHQVLALDPATGRVRWRYQAGGRVNGPPTLAGGMVVFGTGAGWVEAVSITDGRPVWRSLVAPGTRFRTDNAQVESSHGITAPVAVVGERVYAMGGSHSHLDGGFCWAELDLNTGRALRHGFTPTTPQPFEFRSPDNKRPGKGFPYEVDEYRLVQPHKQHSHFQRLPGTYPSTHLAVAYPEMRCSVLTLTPEGWLGLGKIALDPKSGTILKAGKDFGYVDSGHWGNDLKAAPRYPVATQGGLLGKGLDQATMGGVRAKQIAYRGNRFVALACTAPGDYAARNILRLLALCEIPDDGSGKAKLVWEVPWEGRPPEMQGLLQGPPALAVAGGAAFVGWGKQMRRYDLASGKLLATIELPAPPTQAGIAAADGQLVVSCQDGSVLSWK